MVRLQPGKAFSEFEKPSLDQIREFEKGESASPQAGRCTWPRGRWFRDRGNGTGHFWDHVQVINPPVLLEFSGPMFMSYPALNPVELRLDQIAGGTKVSLWQRAIGFLDAGDREGVSKGSRHYLDSNRKDFAGGVAAHRA